MGIEEQMTEPEVGRVVVWYAAPSKIPFVILTRMQLTTSIEAWEPADAYHYTGAPVSYSWTQALEKFKELDGPYILYPGKDVGRL